MAQQRATFYPTRLSQFVPNCAFAADAVYNMPNKIDFGYPAAASTSNIVSGFSLTSAAQTITSFGGATAVGPIALGVLTSTATTSYGAQYGRVISAVGSSTAANHTMSISGRDYLGQRVVTQKVLTGTTAVTFPSALMYVDSIATAAGGSSGATVSLGVAVGLGLPYKSTNLIAERVNHVTAAAGTFTAGAETSPRLVGSADPRGLYAPASTLNGTNRIEAFLQFDETNLHGIAHVIA